MVRVWKRQRQRRPDQSPQPQQAVQTRGSETIDVLQGLNLDVEAGDFVAFMGPSGSGKTTLLNLLGGLDVPTAGLGHRRR
jgi:ABC-type lipoprotein export system ATPase subunit